MSTPVDLVTALSAAVGEITGLIREWVSGADVRRLKAAVEAGEKYILTNEDDKIEAKEKAKLLTQYRKKFFAYN